MQDEPVELDQRRGMAAQKATELRRRLKEVQADQAAVRKRQEEFEHFMLAAPSTTLQEVAAKARYLLQLYATSHEASDPRRQRLIASVVDDLARLTE
jgi:hypothetical protein